MRVLVIDDSSFMRHFLHSLFSARGIECAEAANGREGLDSLREEGPFDVALVDWNMPGLSGFEVLCSARAQHAFDATKIVMITTEAENDRIDAALGAGADEYIVKPFDEVGLFEKLRMAGVEDL